jgi:hypothetical protein
VNRLPAIRRSIAARKRPWWARRATSYVDWFPEPSADTETLAGHVVSYSYSEADLRALVDRVLAK